MRNAIVILLLVAGACFAQSVYPVDPTLWRRMRDTYLPARNPAGATGLEVTGDGNLGRADILFWNWNMAPNGARQLPPYQWNEVDVTRAGIPLDACAADIHIMDIITPIAPGSYFWYLFRAYGTGYLNPDKWTTQVSGIRIADTVTVPLRNGKFEFYWLMLPIAQPQYPYGSAYGAHFTASKWYTCWPEAP